jgi:hypothetical protein
MLMNIRIPLYNDLETIVFETALNRFGPFVRSPKKMGQAIQELSDFYIADPASRGACPNTPEHQVARMTFFTLADLPKAYLLAAEYDHLIGFKHAGTVKVLDLGVGYGAQSLGFLTYLFKRAPAAQVRLDTVDRDASALDAFEEVIMNCQNTELFGNVVFNRWQLDLEHGFKPRDQYDVILVGNTLCELSAAAHRPLILKLLAALTEAGVLFIIEPALKTTARNLHHLRDTLLAEQRCALLAPCTRQAGCPCLLNEKDWCHEARNVQFPPHCQQLANLTGLRRFDMKWAYLTLTRRSSPNEKYTDAWRVVSDVLHPKGKYECFLCGTPGRLRTMLQKRDRTPTNADFQELQRGQFVRIQNAESSPDLLKLTDASEVRIDDPIL